jgi:hypothetical protein
MRAFYERAAYPFLPYNGQTTSLFPKKINVGLILTIGADDKIIKEAGMNRHFELTATMMGFIFGAAELLLATNANLFRKNTETIAENDVIAEFTKNSEEMFIANCQNAFDMGAHLLEEKHFNFSGFNVNEF